MQVEYPPCLDNTEVCRSFGRESRIKGLYDKITRGRFGIFPVLQPSLLDQSTFFRCGVLHVQGIPVSAPVTGFYLVLVHSENLFGLPFRKIAATRGKIQQFCRFFVQPCRDFDNFPRDCLIFRHILLLLQEPSAQIIIMEPCIDNQDGPIRHDTCSKPCWIPFLDVSSPCIRECVLFRHDIIKYSHVRSPTCYLGPHSSSVVSAVLVCFPLPGGSYIASEVDTSKYLLEFFCVDNVPY